MIQARIHRGQIEVQDPIPPEWEGQVVKVLPLTPDDPIPDLEQSLAVLAALGPAEFEADEPERITQSLTEMDRPSREALQRVTGNGR